MGETPPHSEVSYLAMERNQCAVDIKQFWERFCNFVEPVTTEPSPPLSASKFG